MGGASTLKRCMGRGRIFGYNYIGNPLVGFRHLGLHGDRVGNLRVEKLRVWGATSGALLHSQLSTQSPLDWPGAGSSYPIVNLSHIFCAREEWKS